MLSLKYIRLADLYKINIYENDSDETIRFIIDWKIEANNNKIQEKELVRCWIWHYDKFWYLIKANRL
jgi:hypothetical protein